uniref:Uncharacterized protein n=1 Tax=Anguilla anguilla TaxID=7936 RepID=A0A0E9X659_ANGAN
MGPFTSVSHFCKYVQFFLLKSNWHVGLHPTATGYRNIYEGETFMTTNFCNLNVL